MLVLDQNNPTEIQKKKKKIKRYAENIWWLVITSQQLLGIMESEGEFSFTDIGCLR